MTVRTRDGGETRTRPSFGEPDPTPTSVRSGALFANRITLRRLSVLGARPGESGGRAPPHGPAVIGRRVNRVAENFL